MGAGASWAAGGGQTWSQASVLTGRDRGRWGWGLGWVAAGHGVCGWTGQQRGQPHSLPGREEEGLEAAGAPPLALGAGHHAGTRTEWAQGRVTWGQPGGEVPEVEPGHQSQKWGLGRRVPGSSETGKGVSELWDFGVVWTRGALKGSMVSGVSLSGSGGSRRQLRVQGRHGSL